MEKLQEKRQSEKFREQAALAVTIYFDLVARSTKRNTLENQVPREQKGQEVQYFPTRKSLFKQENNGMDIVFPGADKPGTSPKVRHENSGSDWAAVDRGLEDAIKIHHYSPATLKIYVSCTRKLQTFIKSNKDNAADTSSLGVGETIRVGWMTDDCRALDAG